MSQDKLVAGRYRYIRSLGRGGFSDVCLAEDVRLGGRYVAIKRIAYHLLHDPERLDKFQQEAEIIGRLTSPFTVRAFDYGKDDDGRYFIVMEYVEGLTLHRALANEGPFTVERSLQIGIQLLDALEEAHEQGIIHRDLKPKNIILAPSRQGDLVKVLDFGVARILDPEDESDDWTLVGTASYMAPEQAQGKPVSPASDLYSVGVLLYHALTGKPPFVSREDPVAVMIHHATKPVQPMREARPDLDIPEELDKIILRALEKQPSRRFTSASEYRDALEEILVGEQLNDTYEGGEHFTDPYGTVDKRPRSLEPPSSEAASLPVTEGLPHERPFAWPPRHGMGQTQPDLKLEDDDLTDVSNSAGGLHLTGTNPDMLSVGSELANVSPDTANTTPSTPAVRSGTLHSHLPPPPMVSQTDSPAPKLTLPLGEDAFQGPSSPRVGQPSDHDTNSFEGQPGKTEDIDQTGDDFVPSSHEEIDADTQLTSAEYTGGEALEASNARALGAPGIDLADERSVSQSSIISRGMSDLDKELERKEESFHDLPEDNIDTASREDLKAKIEDDLDHMLSFKNEHEILDALMESSPKLPEVPQEELPSTLDLKPGTTPKNEPTHPSRELTPPPPEDILTAPHRAEASQELSSPGDLPSPSRELTPPPRELTPPPPRTDKPPPTEPRPAPVFDVASMPEIEEPTDDDWDLDDTAQNTMRWQGLASDEDATMSLRPEEQTARHHIGDSFDGMSLPEPDAATDPDNDPGSTMLDVSRSRIDEHTLEPTESGHPSPYYAESQPSSASQPAPAFNPQQFRDPFALNGTPNANVHVEDTQPHTLMRPHAQAASAPSGIQTAPNPVRSPEKPLASWDLPPAFLEPDDASQTKTPQELGFDWQPTGDNEFDSGSFDGFQPHQRLRWGIIGGFAFLVVLVVILASAGEDQNARLKRHQAQAYKDALQAGDKAISLGKYNDAYASYRQALKHRPNDRAATQRLQTTQLDLEAHSLLKRADVLERKGQLLQAYRLLQKIDTKAPLWEERGKKALIQLHHLILKRLGRQIVYYRRKRQWRMAHVRCKILPQFYNKHPLLQKVCPYVRRKYRRRRR